MADNQTETILIVDDEEPVRRTFREWLTGAGLPCTILAAPDAEAALQLANQQPVDLAILDWALGAGDDGLQLLQDLYAFHPDVVAIMITGYANQATPLDAMRMGVRDYLDKNHDLSRGTFLHAVKRQLEHIRPAKHARRLHQGLVAFREAVEKILPLVQSAAALTDPVPLPDAVRGLVRFLIQATRAKDGILLVRQFDAAREPAETVRVYDAAGQALEVPLAPFNRSVAGTVVSMQKAFALHQLQGNSATLELQPFEKGRRALLAAPMNVAPGLHAVIELFDPRGDSGFSEDDQRLVQAAADLGAELLRQALGQRQTQQMLLDAVAAALGATEQVAETLKGTSSTRRLEEPPPPQVLDQLRAGLRSAGSDSLAAEKSLRLAEAIRVLALKHGNAALDHCLRLVENLRSLLDQVTGAP